MRGIVRAKRVWFPGGVLFAGLALLATASGGPADPGTKVAEPVKEGPDLPGIVIVPPSLPKASQPAAAPLPEAQTIEQLISGLVDLRAKKAELERQEQAAIKTLREKLKEQKQRLAALGIEPEERRMPELKKADILPAPAPDLNIPPLDPPARKQ